jgi:RHS repeat-associated protein
LSYAYGTAGANNSLISTITDSADNGRSASYTYDSLYRLSTAVTTGSTSYPQWGLSWGYDRYGNRLNQTLTAGSGYQGSVTVDATTNHITGSPYAYDSNGNLLDDGTSTLVYDAENRITTAQNGSASGTYSYDGNSLRVKKVAGSTTTVYIFSSSKVIAEYDNGAAVGSPSREYVYSGARLLAKLDSTGTKYYHQDHLSNRLVTDSSGNTTEQTGHFPFGDSWYNANNEKLVFTSYERDAESGNDYAMARYYVSRLGRFSSADLRSGSVDNPQSLNRYAYVLNNPLNFLDPFGLDPCSSAGDCAGGGGGGGAPCDTEVYTTDDNGNLVVTITPCPVDFTNSPFPDPFGNGADSGGPNFPSGGGPAISNDLQKQINCAMGLEMTKKDSAAVDRANAIWDTIQTAGDTHGIDPSLLAAVAVRESGVQNIPEKGGKGRGRFQIDLGQHPGVTAEQAQDLAFSANYAAGILSSNMNSLAARLPNFTQEQLLHATAASYNLGAGKKGISGNPDTIDAGSPFGNYGSTVMLLMDCF